MRVQLLRLTVAAAAIAAAAAAVEQAKAAVPNLRATVGPGFTIQLMHGAKRVIKLRTGTYRLVVSDRSPIHDFHVSGPGLNKLVTGVSFVGTKTIKIKLKRGTYRYVCDPHRTLMRGRFTVS